MKMINFELDLTLPETGYYCTCCKNSEVDHSGVYVLASEAEAEIEGWKETASQYARNEDYYRGLVQGIGKHFGAEAYTSDDGSIQQDILCAKVPSLVAQMNERLWELESGPGWSETMAMEGKIERLEAELLEKRQSIVLTAEEADKNIDKLESQLTAATERERVMVDAATAVLEWRNFDGDGISDPVRQNLINALAQVNVEK